MRSTHRTRTASKPPARSGSKAKSLAPAIDRAIEVLTLLESQPQQPFSLSEIARALSIPKSTASNICTTMVARQFMRKSDTGYQLGRRLVQIGAAYVSSVDIIREFYEVSRQADSGLRAMIQLAVLDDELNAVYLARQDCSSGFRLGLRAEIGRRVPANCTAAGKALLAALPVEELEKRLAVVHTLPSLTRRSITAPDKLDRELSAIRRRGFSTDDEEALHGVCCVSRTYRTSHREDGLLAVSVSAFKDTLTQARRKLMRATLDEMIDHLQQRL
jgi:DNA-binding IclR family transcriptional regulator